MDRRQVPLDRRPPICRARPLGQTVIEPPAPVFLNTEEPPTPEPTKPPQAKAPKKAKHPKQADPGIPETIQVLT